MGKKNLDLAICLIATLCAASVTSSYVYAAERSITISSDPVLKFAENRYRDIKKIILGPNGQPAPVIEPYQTCQQLYRRRLELLPQTLNYKPDYWDDPRNQVAVFLGTMFTPAFYFLGYSGISAYLDAANQIDPRIELDALRHASARQRCFTR